MEKNEHGNPQTLFKLCINFISSNLHQVDSLCNFPDDISKEILMEAIKKGCLETPDERCTSILQLYTKAFPESLIHALQGPIPAFQVETFKWQIALLIPYLTFLDLSYCNLNTSSLQCILESICNANRLKVLKLRRCGIVEASVKKMVLPVSMFGKGLAALEYLDICENWIPGKSIVRILKFPRIATIVFSEPYGSFERELESHGFTLKEDVEVPLPRTAGWLDEYYDNKFKAVPVPLSSTAKSFYGGNTVSNPSRFGRSCTGIRVKGSEKNRTNRLKRKRDAGGSVSKRDDGDELLFSLYS